MAQFPIWPGLEIYARVRKNSRVQSQSLDTTQYQLSLAGSILSGIDLISNFRRSRGNTAGAHFKECVAPGPV
jgi:hypothetical protein